jgi:uncharacterized cupin superfamily protein
MSQCSLRDCRRAPGWNRSGEPCRILILSAKSPIAIVHYPESDKVGLWSREEGYQTILRTRPELDYWEVE